DDGDLDGLDGVGQAAGHLLEVGGDAPALQLVADRVPAGAGRRRLEHVEQRDGDGSDLGEGQDVVEGCLGTRRRVEGNEQTLERGAPPPPPARLWSERSAGTG